MAPLGAAVYTYEITNAPSVQDGATLTGTISIDTTGGFESPASSGNFFVGHPAIVAWSFAVAPASGGGAPYLGSSVGINPSATGSGGSFALYATQTTLSVVEAGSLTLQSDFNVPGADVSLSWAYDAPLYFAGGVAVGGATWLNTDRGALDATFPTNPDASSSNWTIATAIPEPGTVALLLMAFGSCVVHRRRSHR